MKIQENNQKEKQQMEECIKVIELLKQQLEEQIQEKNTLFEENENLQKQFEIEKNAYIQNLKDKQLEINQLGEKYEYEIQNIRKEMNDKILNTNQDNLLKIDIFVKENLRLEEQFIRLEKSQKEAQSQNQIKDIQIESLKSELKQIKEQYEQEIQKQQTYKVKEESYKQPLLNKSSQQSLIYIEQSTSSQQSQRYQSSPVKRSLKILSQDKLKNNNSIDIKKQFINEQNQPNIINLTCKNTDHINIQPIVAPQIPTKSVQYEQDKAIKNLLAKINDFIEQKDTNNTSENLNVSQSNINPKSSLNNHYNKKLRILRTSNNSSLNSSIIHYPESNRRGQSLINQSLNDSYASVYNQQQNQQTHTRNYSIERECNIKNPYNQETDDMNRSYFFPHSNSNSNLNTQRRAVSTHVNSNQITQQKAIERIDSQYINNNHNRSFFSESDTSKGNLDFLTINQNIGHNNSRESPLRIEDEFNIIQQQQLQQTQLQQQMNQDISMISKPQTSENNTTQVNEYNYMNNKLQDKIEIKINNQKQTYQLHQKENYPHAGNYSNNAENNITHKRYSNHIGNQQNNQLKRIENQNNQQQAQNQQQFQSTLEIQQKLAKWDNMDQLAIDDEDQDGLMSSIKDLQSKIKLIQK